MYRSVLLLRDIVDGSAAINIYRFIGPPIMILINSAPTIIIIFLIIKIIKSLDNINKTKH